VGRWVLCTHRDNFLNGYYDDEGWWALTWINAYDLTGNRAYLSQAKDIFADMTGGWDGTCGGGIWWSKARGYKNAIANEIFLQVAVALHERTPADIRARPPQHPGDGPPGRLTQTAGPRRLPRSSPGQFFHRAPRRLRRRIAGTTGAVAPWGDDSSRPGGQR
jgi:hypothetical protein